MGKITVKTTDKKSGAVNIKVTKTRSRVSKNVKRAIKRAINAASETKIAVKQIWQQNIVLGAGLDAGSGLGLTTSGISGTPTTILPPLPQGDGDSQRDGNVVNPKKLVLKYSLRALDTTGNTAGTNPFRGKPFYARVIVYNKRYAIDDYANSGIIDKGTGVGNIDSSPDSWLEPYNKRDFKILYSKTYKMCAFSDTSVTPPSLENMPNGFKNFIMAKANIKIPKRLYYAKDADSDPQNCAPKMAVCICNVDGTVVTNVQYRLQVNTEAQLFYQDS